MKLPRFILILISLTGLAFGQAQQTNTNGANIDTDGEANSFLTALARGTSISFSELQNLDGLSFGTGVKTALGVDIGFAGSPVLYNGSGGQPSSLSLTNASGLPLSGLVNSTSLALGIGSIELGHASDTTLSRSAAGKLAVEGVDVVSTSGNQTITGVKTFDASMTVRPVSLAVLQSGGITLQSTTNDWPCGMFLKSDFAGTPRLAIEAPYNTEQISLTVGNTAITGAVQVSGTLTVGGTNTWNGSTITGAQAFSSTTRPTSSGTGTPASNSLITQNDYDFDFIRNPLQHREISCNPDFYLYNESASAGYVCNLGSAGVIQIYADPSAAQNDWYRYNFDSYLSGIYTYLNREIEYFFAAQLLSSTTEGTKVQIALSQGAPEGTINSASLFGIAIEAYATGGVKYVRLARKLTAASTIEYSSAIAIPNAECYLWLKTNTDGGVELRLVNSTNATSIPTRPASASATLPAGSYDLMTPRLYITGIATAATAADNAQYTQIYTAKLYIYD